MKITAIIGFGFCGKVTFANLVKKYSPQENKIIIFEAAKDNFSSAAFSAYSPNYILNVPAAKMSAFCGQDKDFCDFLQKNYSEIWKNVGENGFAPREIYGKYLDQITENSFKHAKEKGLEFELINGEATEVNAIADKLLITSQGKEFIADELALATSFRQSQLPLKIESTNFVRNLWNKDAAEFHQKNFTNESICLIGSGLTTVDVIVGLKKKNFAGKIFVISRRGNFPKKHFASPQQNPNFIRAEDSKKGVLFLCLKIRHFLRQNPEFDIRHVIDSIRPITTALWNNLDEKNKKLFLRLFCYWNIFRHRAPISSIETIEQMIASGQIEIKKGGVKNVKNLDGKFSVQTKFDQFEADYLVNCLGFEFNAKKYDLLNQMIDSGLLASDFMMARSLNPKIHLLGGLNIGRDFECTAVPDLRVNVENVVSSLL